MKAFYYVYNYGNLMPKVRHLSLESAQKEAERLTLQHNLSYEILKCVGVTRMTKAETVMIDDEPLYYCKDKDSFPVKTNKGF